MVKILKSNHFLKAGALCLLVIVVAAIFGVRGVSAQKPTPDDQHPFGVLKAIDKSEQGLHAYKNALAAKVKKVKDAKQEDVFVTITFSDFVDKAALKDMAGKYHFKVRSVNLRAYEESGLPATIQLAPTEAGQLIDEDTLSRMLDGNNANLAGIIELIGTVSYRDIEAFSSDSRVFIVDPSADDIFMDNPKEIYMPGLFWYLEKNHMVN